MALFAYSLDSLGWKNCGNHTMLFEVGKINMYTNEFCEVKKENISVEKHSVWLSNTDECDLYGMTCMYGAVHGLKLSEYI